MARLARVGGSSQRRHGAHGELMALPNAVIWAAPLSASDSVGWAWQTRARSSEAAPYSIPTQASAINSPAMELTMCTPSNLSVALSASTFTKPASSATHLARELAPKTNLPFLYTTPSLLSCSSVLPTQATSGYV